MIPPLVVEPGFLFAGGIAAIIVGLLAITVGVKKFGGAVALLGVSAILYLALGLPHV